CRNAKYRRPLRRVRPAERRRSDIRAPRSPMAVMDVSPIVVVGAGPAGSTAARLLAERGARVVLLEARRLPRPKLCGGGLTPKALPYLAGNAAATIDREVDLVDLAGRWPSLHLRLP